MQRKLTKKEQEIMELFWDKGPMFVRELLDCYEDPKPALTTLSTMVRILEQKGFMAHKAFGTAHQYYPLLTREEYMKCSLTSLISDYFENSYVKAVSALVKEEKITVEELKDLIAQIEAGKEG
jgi:predicted transcriptional regulator